MESVSSTGEFISRKNLPGNQRAASAARTFVRSAIAEWTARGLRPADSTTCRLVDDGMLLISELVTNAVIHAGTSVDVLCRLDTRCEPAAVVIEVSDRHPARVVRGGGHPEEDRDGGRGLQLVDGLSHSWGITYHRDRKTVWCRLECAGDDGRNGSAPPQDAYGHTSGWERRSIDILVPAPARGPRRYDSDWLSRGSLSFLAEASDLLAGQLDEDNVASLAGQLLVPRLADWCAVWLAGPGPEQRLAQVWHSSENRIEALRLVLEKEPPPADAAPGAAPWPWPPPHGLRSPDGAALAFPLLTAGQYHGTLLLGRHGLPRIPDEVTSLLEDFARRVALAISTASQYSRQARVSQVLQRGLLPPEVGRIPGVDTAIVYEPTGEGVWAGGDFYDLFQVHDGRWCFALGDVCGSGPEAASVTGIARPVIRWLARQGFGVADVLDRLNKAFTDEAAASPTGEVAAWEGGRTRFLSLLYGEIVPHPSGRGARCTVGSAGHPLPLVLAADGVVRPAASPQILLGIADEVRYGSQTFDLLPGDTLLCVTDGVTERRRGDRQFDDDDGLASVLGGCAGLGAAGVAERIRRAVHDYDDTPPDDDLAMLVLRAQ
ncbi:SpoIIE family protein phosphatase [Streptomyces sp. NPDC006733]|uniref:SpoIIE family protein phosphatase n=1 Tax=Streptomyces sp. NPDC006733 TaxID=3155460 RepID=UPI0033D9B6D3